MGGPWVAVSQHQLMLIGCSDGLWLCHCQTNYPNWNILIPDWNTLLQMRISMVPNQGLFECSDASASVTVKQTIPTKVYLYPDGTHFFPKGGYQWLPIRVYLGAAIASAISLDCKTVLCYPNGRVHGHPHLPQPALTT